MANTDKFVQQICQALDAAVEKTRTAIDGAEESTGFLLYKKTMEEAKQIVQNCPSPCGECSRRKFYQEGYADGQKAQPGETGREE